MAVREDRGQQMCMLFMFNRACKVWEVWGRVVEVGESGEGGRQCLVLRGALSRHPLAVPPVPLPLHRCISPHPLPPSPLMPPQPTAAVHLAGGSVHDNILSPPPLHPFRPLLTMSPSATSPNCRCPSCWWECAPSIPRPPPSTLTSNFCLSPFFHPQPTAAVHRARGSGRRPLGCDAGV